MKILAMSPMITTNLHTKDLLYIPNYVLTLEKYFIQNQNNCFDLKISSDYFKLNIDLTDKTYLGFCNFIRNILFKVISKICLDTFKDFYREPANIETVYKGKILEILQKDNLYHPSIILEITDVCSYHTGRIGTKSKKLQSTNIFALKE